MAETAQEAVSEVVLLTAAVSPAPRYRPAVDFNRDVHCLLGLPVDAVTLEQAVGRVRSAVTARRRCFLSTPNLSFLNGCLGDRRFRDSVINSDLSVADGMPLVLVALLLGIPISERVPGAGLFEALRRDPRRKISVFFFGGPDGVAAAAGARLNSEDAGLVCVGHHSPGFGSVEEMSSDAIIDKINASGADFLVVALGARKGQAWIERNRARIAVPVISHLGAVVNFTAGTVSRAPRWMQRVGLEWLWRIKEEPELWLRYWRDGMALVRLLLTRVLPYAWHLRWHPADASELASARVRRDDEGEVCVLVLEGAWLRENLGPLRLRFADAADSGRPIRVDLRGVTRADSAFVGLVMLLHGHLAAHRRSLQIVPPQPQVRRVFRYCCADFVLEG